MRFLKYNLYGWNDVNNSVCNLWTTTNPIYIGTHMVYIIFIYKHRLNLQ